MTLVSGTARYAMGDQTLGQRGADTAASAADILGLGAAIRARSLFRQSELRWDSIAGQKW